MKAIVSFAFSLAIAVLLHGGLSAQFILPPVDELKRMVEQREKEFGAAEVALASARAQLAKAEGKKELAAAEWRKVLSCHEKLLKAMEERYARGRECYVEPLAEAQGAVAIDRVWLAELEDRRDDLRTELPKVIAYYEFRIQLYERLIKHRVISQKEADEGIKESRQELRWAQDRLTSLRKPSPDQDKKVKER
jgi:hypothetical protein